MKIVQVNYSDGAGGAARIAWLLHKGFESSGSESWMAVSRKRSQDPRVVEIPRVSPSAITRALNDSALWADQQSPKFLFGALYGLLRRTAAPKKYWDVFWGIEDFNFPNSRRILDLISARPDIVHLHNLHTDYFDLTYLPRLSSTVPTMITLHDTWLLSGHCAHALDCDRWKTGCGYCPHLDIYPKIKRDSTRYNWNRKRHIYQRSKLYIAAPSQWMMDEVNQSMLAPAVQEARVIHNGIDLDVFRPLDTMPAREILGLPLDANILLFVASGVKSNPFKDYRTIEAAVHKLAEKKTPRKILVIALGDNSPAQQVGDVEIRFVPFSGDPALVATYYQASDLYIHAALADTFPNVILESLACGLPVIATNVGGIGEQVQDGQTGYLVPKGDSTAMAARIEQLLNNDEQRKRMGEAAARDAKERFGLERMLGTYFEWYQGIIARSRHEKTL